LSFGRVFRGSRRRRALIKVVFLVRRAPGIGHDDFVRHLLERHVPLALRHHPRLRRYASSPIVPGTPNPGGYDAVAELWFDSLDDFRQGLYDSDEGRRVIAADVARFCTPGSDCYVTEELVFKDEIGARPVYRPGVPVGPLGGETLPGNGWGSEPSTSGGRDDRG
jgi:uncharacterized protein (TIGR02118 family)